MSETAFGGGAGRTGDVPTEDPGGASGDGPASFDRVLVAFDGDGRNDRVVRAAVDLAATHGASLHALSVVRMNASVDHWDFVVERREDAAERALDAAGEVAAGAGVPIEKHLRYGTPAEEIDGYARFNEVDLVVMGEPDREGWGGLLRPTSVTERVRRAASVPVLSIPEGDDATTGRSQAGRALAERSTRSA